MKPKMTGIYSIRNKSNGMLYIGRSIDLARRLYEHRQAKCHRHQYIDRSIKKYGVDAFAFEFLELCDESDLGAREIFWIAALNCVSPNGYNLTYGGDGGGRPSEETRRKKSGSLSGENNPMYGRTGEKNPRYGAKLTSEHRAILLASNKGAKRTAGSRAKMSETRKKNMLNPEKRCKMSVFEKGHEVTAETRAKLASAARRQHQKKSSKHQLSFL